LIFPLRFGRGFGCYHLGQDRCSAFYTVAYFDFEFRSGGKNYVSARTKLDHAHPLSASERVTNFTCKDNSARKQSGDLLEDQQHALPFNRNNVLFVGVRRSSTHGIAELPAFVDYLCDYTRDGRAVHMDVKDIQENADSGRGFAIELCGHNVRDFAVSGRNYQTGLGGDSAFRIAKEPQEKRSEQNGDGGKNRRRKPEQQPGNN